MLDDLSTHDEIEGCATEAVEEVFVGGKKLETAGRMGRAGMGDALFAEIDPDDLATETKKLSAGESIAAADVEDPGAGTYPAGQSHHLRHEMPVHVRGIRTGEAEVFVLA